MSPPWFVKTAASSPTSPKMELVTLNATMISRDQIEGVLRAIFANRQPKLLYIRADPQVAFGAVMRLIELPAPLTEYISLAHSSGREAVELPEYAVSASIGLLPVGSSENRVSGSLALYAPSHLNFC